MIPPRFEFARIPFSVSAVRPVTWSAAAAAAVYAVLRHRKQRLCPMPPRHPDQYVRLSADERAVWEQVEDEILGDVGLAILDEEAR